MRYLFPWPGFHRRLPGRQLPPGWLPPFTKYSPFLELLNGGSALAPAAPSRYLRQGLIEKIPLSFGSVPDALPRLGSASEIAELGFSSGCYRVLRENKRYGGGISP